MYKEYIEELKKARRHLDDAVNIFSILEQDLKYDKGQILPKEIDASWRDASFAFSHVNEFLEREENQI